MFLVPVFSNLSQPFSYYVFVYFLEGQVHKDNKLEIVTNVGRRRLVKSSLQNIHKMSDACTNSFGRYIKRCTMYEKCSYFFKLQFLRKNGVSEKMEGHFPQQRPALQ